MGGVEGISELCVSLVAGVLLHHLVEVVLTIELSVCIERE